MKRVIVLEIDEEHITNIDDAQDFEQADTFDVIDNLRDLVNVVEDVYEGDPIDGEEEEDDDAAVDDLDL